MVACLVVEKVLMMVVKMVDLKDALMDNKKVWMLVVMMVVMMAVKMAVMLDD